MIKIVVEVLVSDKLRVNRTANVIGLLVSMLRCVGAAILSMLVHQKSDKMRRILQIAPLKISSVY